MDGQIREWEAPSAVKLRQWNAPDTDRSISGFIRRFLTGPVNEDGDTSKRRDRPILSLGYTADGASVVFGAGDDSVFLLEREGSTHEELVPGDQSAYTNSTLRWSHDSVAFRMDFMLGAWEQTASVSSDGRRVAYVHKGTSIRLLDVHAADRWRKARIGEESDFRSGWAGPVAVSLDPTGCWVAAAMWGGRIEIWEFATARLARAWRAYEGPVRWISDHSLDLFISITWSPDGRLLTSTHKSGAIHLWDAATGEAVLGLDGHAGGTLTVTFSPDGGTLASCGFDATALLWDVRKAYGSLKSSQRQLGPKEFEVLWEDLAGGDATRAHNSLRTLVANPAAAMPLIRKRIQPLAAADPEDVRRFVKKLDADDFGAREDADRALRVMGEAAEEELGKVLEGDPSLEVRMRVQSIRGARPAMPIRTFPSEQLRTLRACQILGEIGTVEALELLLRIEKESRSSIEKAEAKAAHARLEAREPK